MTDRYASLKQGLVGCWIPSVSGSGLLLPDLSGRGNNGALTGMDASDWVSGQYGRALDFDGVDDEVTTNAISSLNSANQFTITYWASKNSALSDMLVGSRLSSTNGVWLQWYSDGVVYFSVRNGQANFIQHSLTYRSDFIHFAATYSNTSSAIYIDGKSVASGTNGTVSSTGFDDFGIGALFGGFFAAGKIDDVRLYSRALTEPEIKLLASQPGIGFKPAKKLSRFSQRFTYNPPKARNYGVVRVKETDYATLRQGLVGAWCPSLPNGGSGNTLPDQSGYSNHGSLVNMSPDDWVSGQYGRALDFDGSNDEVRITLNSLANTFNSNLFSFALWANVRSFSNSPVLVSSSRLDEASSDDFLIETNNNGSILYVKTADGAIGLNGARTYTLTSALITNNWFNVAFLKTGLGNNGRLFVNGIEQTSFTGSLQDSIVVDFQPLRLGIYSGGIVPLNGQLDDVRVYSRPLSEPEIKLLASRPGIGLRQESHRQTFYQFPSFQPAIARRSSAIIGGGIT